LRKYVEWITYKGKRILVVNGPGLKEAQYIEAMEEMKQEVLKEKDGALVLANVSGLDMTKAVVNKSREVVNATKEAGIPNRANVVVGLTGLQKAVAQLFGRGVHFVDTVEQAKELLVKEDDKLHKS
jgi:methanogenic corrinoid protein MtbC1